MNLVHKIKTAYEEGSYLLDGAVGGDLVAASNSLKTVKLYSADTLQYVGELKGHKDAIKDLRFSKVGGGGVVMSVGDSGTVMRWDTRALTGEKLPIKMNGGEIESGDISCDGSLLAVGDGMDIVVYDTRKLTTPLVNLDGFHTEVITRVRFHESTPTILTTGSEDGLLIVVNPLADNEDDATTWIFNVNNPINTVTYSGSKVVATTSTEGVFCGCLESGGTVFAHDRPDESLYVINPVGDNMLWGVKGEDNESRYGEILLAPLDDPSTPTTWPVLKGGHEDLVRFAHYNPHTQLLYTGGEDGFLSAWSNFQMRSGHATESRIPASKPTMTEEETDMVYTGDCTVTARPLVAHKTRKATTKTRKQAPY